MNENGTNNSICENFTNCSILKFSGIYSIILFLISLIANTTLLWILIKHKKKLLCFINSQMLAISVLCLFETLIDLPIITVTSLYSKFVYNFLFEYFRCIFDTFLKVYFGKNWMLH
jgi:hypothetical protein